MASTTRLVNVNAIRKLFSSLSVGAVKTVSVNAQSRLCSPFMSLNACLHSTPPKKDLMEFFDEKKNWGQNEVKVGRSWTKEDLRIKSNTDLHKLWFVLLKERNMLLTVEHECKEQVNLFPSPERLDKVKESMENLEEVVRERNRAYFELETGETGERPAEFVYNPLGLRYFYRKREYSIPKHMNSLWQKTHRFGYHGSAVHKFLKLYREKLFLTKRKTVRRNTNHVVGLLRRYPHLDDEILRQKYPDVDLEEVRKNKKTQEHRTENST